MNEFVFVIKVSKFCNLRCEYCYEHRELHIRDQMRVATLERLFEGVDAFGDCLVAGGVSPRFSFVWHGGEPLLLPAEFYEVMAGLQARTIGRFGYRNSVQTNLFGNVQRSLATILELGWDLGVSIDFADGVRTNVRGRDSNSAVIVAAESLRQSGSRFGVLSVLGAHNRRSLFDAYDWVSEFAESWRILPIFAGGPEDSIRRLRLADEEVANVLLELFRRRAGADRYISILPLDDFAKAATLRIAGVADATSLDADMLDNVYLVNVNGDVFTRPFAYEPAFCLGNVNHRGLPEMIESDAYKSCQARIRCRKSTNCKGCEFRGYCDTSPMHENGLVSDGERCAVAHGTIARLEQALLSDGVDRSVIAAWAREWLTPAGSYRAP